MAVKKNPSAPRKKARTGPSSKQGSPEYQEYLRRYEILGEDRPKLSPAEFEQLDDELLELLARDSEDLTDEQIVRIQELEFLLIDSE